MLVSDGFQSHLLGFLDEQCLRRLVLVRNFAVEDSVLDEVLQRADLATWPQTEHLHDVLATDGRLEVADAVFLLNLHEFRADGDVVVGELLLLHVVLRRDVGGVKKDFKKVQSVIVIKYLSI